MQVNNVANRLFSFFVMEWFLKDCGYTTVMKWDGRRYSDGLKTDSGYRSVMNEGQKPFNNGLWVYNGHQQGLKTADITVVGITRS